MPRSSFRPLFSVFFAFLLSILLGWNVVSATPAVAETQNLILYVKPGSNGTCTAWADACELQTALTNAVAGDQIWVAAGTYKPTTTSDRSATFQLKSGVAIYGGFPAAGGGWETRNWKTNLTTLSGDIGILNDNADNSYHVVTGSGVDATAILDGFTISGGNANGDNYPHYYGGGVYNSGSSPSLANVTFNSNTASVGGGMYNSSSSPSLSNVIFTGNSAGNGGGMVNDNSSNPSLSDVTFSSNTASIGGGMYSYNSSPNLSNVIFSSNTATNYGGGMSNWNSSSPSLSNVIFSSNTATNYGGGMYNNYISNPSLSNVTFSSNTASYGGGMSNWNSSNPSLTNVTFSSNSANYGGGMYNMLSSNPILGNVTFSSNTTTNSGGGMYNNYSSSPIVTNSILWGNTPGQIFGSATVTYSDIQGGYSGTGNIEANPLLGPLADNGGFTQTHALGAGSPAIDTADPSNFPVIDQREFARPIDGNGDGTATCDMGAYEYNSHLATFSLTFDNVGSGSVAKNPDQSDYHWGEKVTLTPIAEPGWTFTGWSGDASESDNPLTIIIQGNTNITAIFSLGEYSLTVTPIGSGVVTINPVQETYRYGDEVMLTATYDLGWNFLEWGGDASGSGNPSFITIQGNMNITATFTQNEYSLTVTPIGSGSVAMDPDQTTYHFGDIVTLTPAADPGWRFAGWGGQASGLDNPLIVPITKNTSITATFILEDYTLTVTPIGGGKVKVNPDQVRYHYGDVVTLSPYADPGWEFAGWGGDASGSENPLTISIVGNTNITATFTQDYYTLTVTPINFGSVGIDPLQDAYALGTNVTLTATADRSWNFAGWGGNAGGLDNPLTITITGNMSITATFTTNWIFLPMIKR